jgi:hypothetical protein
MWLEYRAKAGDRDETGAEAEAGDRLGQTGLGIGSWLVL